MKWPVRAKQAAPFALIAAALAVVVLRSVELERPPVAPPASPPVASASSDPGPSRCDAPADRRLTMPTGAPTTLNCDEARRIIGQARSSLAAPPPLVDVAKFGEA